MQLQAFPANHKDLLDKCPADTASFRGILPRHLQKSSDFRLMFDEVSDYFP